MLIGQRVDGVVEDVVEPSEVTVAVSDVRVDGTIHLDKHLEGVLEQL